MQIIIHTKDKTLIYSELYEAFLEYSYAIKHIDPSKFAHELTNKYFTHNLWVEVNE
jgi:hypothetical protein